MKNSEPQIIGVYQPPVVEIEIKDDNAGKVDSILSRLHIPKKYRRYFKDEILNHHKSGLVISLLDELSELYGCKLNHPNRLKLLQIISDLKKIESPIIPSSVGLELEHSLRYVEWTVWDIEREYFQIHVVRDKYPEVPPRDKYLKKEVLAMLNLLLECDVIYNFKARDLFVNDVKGELNSYFRNYKKINVEVL